MDDNHTSFFTKIILKTMPQNNQIVDAIKQICDEKNIPYDSVIETIEQALAAAYRKDFGQKNQNVKCEFKPETGRVKAFDVKTVVEDLPPEEEIESREDKKEGEKKDEEIKKLRNREIEDKKSGQKGTEEKKEGDKEGSAKEEEGRKFNPRTDIQLSDAKKLKKTAKVGDEIKTELEIPTEFGRMAAQTAKQVIIQRLREVERETIFREYKSKEGHVLMGVVQRVEGRTVLIDLGNTTALLLPDQQIGTEKYNPGEHYRFYISQVIEAPKGPEIILSRTHPEIVKQLFTIEVPEVASGTVEIKGISREAGSRSKIAVYTAQSNIDPIGSCVGQRGTRIQTIINELGGEKIDIIEYNNDPIKFISNALSPAKVVSVEIKDKENKIALIKVKPEQLSLAIGKTGQNVRLAAKLTGWKIDIVEMGASGAKSKKDEDKKDGVKAGESSNDTQMGSNISDKEKESDEKEKSDEDKVNKVDKTEEKKDRRSDTQSDLAADLSAVASAKVGARGVKEKGEDKEKEKPQKGADKGKEKE